MGHRTIQTDHTPRMNTAKVHRGQGNPSRSVRKQTYQQRNTTRTSRLWGMFHARRFGEKACPVSMVSGQNPLQRVTLHRTCFVICAHTRVAQPTCTCYSSHTYVPDDRKSNACNNISVPSFLPQLYVDEKPNDWLNDTKYFIIGAKPKIQCFVQRYNGCRRQTDLHLLNWSIAHSRRAKITAIS